jgi:hypothetical protein
MPNFTLGGIIPRLPDIPLNLISAFLERATAHGARFRLLRPVAWLLLLAVAAPLAAVYGKAPSWMVMLLAIFAALVAALFVTTYVICRFGYKRGTAIVVDMSKMRGRMTRIYADPASVSGEEQVPQ